MQMSSVRKGGASSPRKDGSTSPSTEDHGSVLDVSAVPSTYKTRLLTKRTEQYALTEASYVIVKLLQRFDTLENADPGPYPGSQPVMDHSLTMAHWNGVHVRLCSRGQ